MMVQYGTVQYSRITVLFGFSEFLSHCVRRRRRARRARGEPSLEPAEAGASFSLRGSWVLEGLQVNLGW